MIVGLLPAIHRGIPRLAPLAGRGGISSAARNTGEGLPPRTPLAATPPHPNCTGRRYASPRQFDLSPQAGRGKCEAGSRSLLLPKPSRGDAGQAVDGPVIDIGPGLAERAVFPCHGEHLPEIFGRLGKTLAAGL